MLYHTSHDFDTILGCQHDLERVGLVYSISCEALIYVHSGLMRSNQL